MREKKKKQIAKNRGTTTHPPYKYKSTLPVPCTQPVLGGSRHRRRRLHRQWWRKKKYKNTEERSRRENYEFQKSLKKKTKIKKPNVACSFCFLTSLHSTPTSRTTSTQTGTRELCDTYVEKCKDFVCEPVKPLIGAITAALSSDAELSFIKLNGGETGGKLWGEGGGEALLQSFASLDLT